MAPDRAAKKWVSTSSGKLLVSPAGYSVLRKIPEAAPVNLVSIIGPAKTGKSSLMNALIGDGNTFKMSAAVKPCTEGGDLSPYAVRLSEFESKHAGTGGAGRGRRSSTRSYVYPNDDPYVAFADVEGQGDGSVDQDVRLATPFLLLSKVTIFNWLGRPNKTTMLEKLELMVRATDSIIEHDGHEGGKGKVFGHLIILARDLSGPDRAEEIRELLLDNEDPGSSGDRKGAANRNTIRDGLRSSFQSIIVRTLPTPHSHIEERSAVVSPSEFTPTFKVAVNGLRSDIIEMLKTPHTFGGSPISGGDDMSCVMASLCDAVNDSKDISPPSLLQAIGLQRVQKAAVDAVFLATAYLKDMSEQTLSSKSTSAQTRSAKSSAMAAFRTAAKTVTHDIVQEEQEKLAKTLEALASAVDGLQKEKRRRLDDTLAEFAKSAMAEVDLKVQRVPVPAPSPAGLTAKLERIVSDAYTTYATHLADVMPVHRQGDLQEDLSWAMTKAEFSNKVQGSFSRLKERNSAAAQLQQLRKDMEVAHRRERVAQQEKEWAESAKRAACQRAEEERERADEARRANQRHHPASFAAAGVSVRPDYRMCNEPPPPVQCHSRRGRKKKFYKGGQFIPGGGHAPAGGIWL